MYTLIRQQPRAAALDAAARGKPRRWVGRNVLYLGLTSLFTDISSEMVSAVLPLYFIVHLGFTPLAFGFIDGLYQGSSALVRIAGGFAADRSQRHKEVAGFGYALSAVCKLGLLVSGGAWTVLSAVILLDRTGKGVRTSPRDALISMSTSPEMLGTAFGVHRALDTVGALLGPLVAFSILSALPNAFDTVFVASFAAALVGLGVLFLFVENAPVQGTERPERSVSPRAAVGLLAQPRFLLLVVIGALLGVATISDSFLYLVIQRRLDFNIGFFPLLYIGTALSYFALAVPAGWLADRIGRAWVFVGGYVLLLVVYTAILQPSLGMGHVVIYLGLFGAHYAATDGVLMALASTLIPSELRSSGLSLITTVTSLTALLGSVLFGALWTWRGAESAIGVLTGALLVAIIIAAVSLIPGQHKVTNAEAASTAD